MGWDAASNEDANAITPGDFRGPRRQHKLETPERDQGPRADRMTGTGGWVGWLRAIEGGGRGGEERVTRLARRM